jgi:hypothetical protein
LPGNEALGEPAVWIISDIIKSHIIYNLCILYSVRMYIL